MSSLLSTPNRHGTESLTIPARHHTPVAKNSDHCQFASFFLTANRSDTPVSTKLLQDNQGLPPALICMGLNRLNTTTSSSGSCSSGINRGPALRPHSRQSTGLHSNGAAVEAAAVESSPATVTPTPWYPRSINNGRRRQQQHHR